MRNINNQSLKVMEMYNKYPFPSEGNYDNFVKAHFLPAINQIKQKHEIKRILDAGCGTGNLAIDISRYLPEVEVVAVDFSEEPLRLARSKAESLNFKNIEFKKSDLMEYDPELGIFDFVFCGGVIHHLTDPTKGLTNLNRYLRLDHYAYIWFYILLGKRKTLEIREALDVLGIKDLPWEKRLELTARASLLFEKKGLLKKIIHFLQRIEKYGFKGLGRYIYSYFFSKRIPESIALADQILHPQDKFYRFGEAVNEFQKAGFNFVKIIEGMSNSLVESFGSDEICKLTTKDLSQKDIYTLIELNEKPPGIGCLVQKTKNV